MGSISTGVLELEKLSLQDWPRLERMRQAHFGAETEICIELAKNTTEFFRGLKEDPYDSPELTAGRLYEFVMGRKAAIISDESLLAGTTTTKQKGVILYPHFLALTIWPELETIGERSFNPFHVGEAEWKVLNSDVFPFWMDRTIMEVARREFAENGDTPECQKVMERMVFYLASKVYAISHTIPNYEKVLQKGLRAIIKEASGKEEALGNSKEDLAKKDFYCGVQLALGGIINYAGRLGAEAVKQAAEMEASGYPDRAKELATMGEYLARVPAETPRTFQEALNALWICKVALHQENANAALSVGRLDQVLYPFYKKDIEDGRLNPRQAVELVGCLWLKIADHLPVVPETSEELFGGSGSNQAITLGGVGRDGSDSVNDLTYVMLEATQLLKLRDPNVNVRYYPGWNSVDYRDRLARLNLETRATPCFHNDKAEVDSLTTQGISEEDARDYGVVGCVEPTSCGRTFGATGMVLLNLTSVLELTLFAGKHRLTGIGGADTPWNPKSPPPEGMKSFDDFQAAFQGNLEWLVDKAVEFNNHLGLIHQKVHPTPMLSAMMEGCMDKGMDVVCGGATYNSTGVAVIGLADVVDSVTAIEEFTLSNGHQIPMAGMIGAITTNWGSEEKDPAASALFGTYHAKVKASKNKFGYDDSALAAKNAQWVVKLLHSEFQRRRNYRGGPYTVGYWTMTNHAGFGVLTGAMPSGRVKGKPFTSGITPVEGSAPSLPSVLRFVGTLDQTRCMVNGQALNLKFTPPDADEAKKAEFLKGFAGYLDGYFTDHQGLQVQCNIISREDLWKWHEDPKDCPNDVLVRVSGYTAYFNDLNPHMQREIILRAEYDMGSGEEVWKGWIEKPYVPVARPSPSGSGAAKLDRALLKGLDFIEGWLLEKEATVVLGGLLNWMSAHPFVPDFPQLTGDFNGVLRFQTKDGSVDEWVRFSHGAISLAHDAGQKADVTVAFTDGRALVNFLFSPLRSYLNAFATGGDPGAPPTFDILASMLKNEVIVDGNLNYLYRFGFLANHMLLKVFKG